MSAWRKKAIECLPELRKEFEDPDTTIYQVFFELLPATREAHKNNEIEKLKQYYSFAEWCFSQKEKDLWNAAAVAFYEHLGQEPETLAAMPDWVKPEIYLQVKECLEMFTTKENMQKLRNSYKTRFPKMFKE